MRKERLFKSIAKYAIKHGFEITLEAKDHDIHSKNFITESNGRDTGVELRVWMPEKEAEES